MRQPTLFISHGGGPWPFMEERKQDYARTEQELRKIRQSLPSEPSAILVVSGHWEESEFAVSTAPLPSMVYDYYGFPEHTYQIKYPAKGSPEVAERVQQLLQQSGISCRTDEGRGFDHGTFVPLALMFPEADVPVVSMSIKSNYDPLEHFEMGEAIKPLRDEGVLIIGSGLSYHNMQGLRSGTGGRDSKVFEEWLGQVVSERDYRTRKNQLIAWESAPSARQAHPQEDHLIPLMVVAGAAGEGPGHRIFVDEVRGIAMASYRFG